MSKATVLAFALGAVLASALTWIAGDFARPALAQGTILGPTGLWQMIVDGNGNAWRLNTGGGQVAFCTSARCTSVPLP